MKKGCLATLGALVAVYLLSVIVPLLIREGPPPEFTPGPGQKTTASALPPSAYPDCDKRCPDSTNADCMTRCVADERAKEEQKTKAEAETIARTEAEEKAKASREREARVKKPRRSDSSDDRVAMPEAPRRSLTATSVVVDSNGNVIQ